jgi:phenylalanyl-tRNA synthetase beta chain
MRVSGYDQVPATLPPLRAAPARLADDRPDRARRALAAAGLDEAITFGFQNPARLAALRLPADDRRASPIAVRNPMSIDQAILRTSLLPNLLAAVSRNRRFGVLDLALFEVGSVFLRPADAPRDGEPTGLADEPARACAVLAGTRPHRLDERAAWDFFDARGVAEAALAELTELAPRFEADATVPYLHPGVAARVWLGGEVVGHVGEVHPETRRAFDLDVPVFAVELDLSRLAARPVRQMRPIPRFPSASRDVSLLLANDIPAGRVRQVLEEAAEPLVAAVRAAEEYRGEHLPAGHKSMLWSITYRSAERTLTDAEVEAAHEALVARLVRELPAQRR